MKLKLTFKLAFAFLTGILSGQLLTYGIIVWTGRPGFPGGEALILPLFGLLVWFGYQFGREAKVQGRYYETFWCGYRRGYAQGKKEFLKQVKIAFQQPGHIEIDNASPGP